MQIEASGGQALTYGGDVSKEEDVESMVKTAAAKIMMKKKKFTNLKYSRVEIDEVRFEWAECMLDYI
ncbi:hypothetical protein ZIOFF_013835 [Zingiber officinale]|uniref:Uncharacterized protein n=1 Tax=Zingiber officinale TaxID=94328 RepID=A0A8J5HGJ6_ZINOF|nr:hypothetical protein ZIOFF_013835 [Zingiber officinale]